MTNRPIVPVGASVHSIDHFALEVPSIVAAEDFFFSFGLDVTRIGTERPELEIRAADGHRWARILQGDRKSLAYLSFNCFKDNFDELEDQARSAGATIASSPLSDEDGFWFHDPDGNLIQVKVGKKTMPDVKLISDLPGTPEDTRGTCGRLDATHVRPRRLSHVLLFTPDVSRALEFYYRALGLRLSDRFMDKVAFTHAPHGCDHHLLAFGKSGARGWHHASWDVANVNEVGLGAAQMAAAGYARGWGTGRHVLGSNYFHYVQDPWGSFCEYSADIDFVSAGHEWQARDCPPEDALYLWGPPVPDSFLQNSEGPLVSGDKIFQP